MQFEIDSERFIDLSTETLDPYVLGVEGAITLWDFYKAPEKIQKYSTHGGDEDGILWLPNGVSCPWWVESLWRGLGPDQDFIQFKDGMLIIWAHA